MNDFWGEDTRLNVDVFPQLDEVNEDKLLHFKHYMELTNHHFKFSTEYRKILQALFPNWKRATSIEELPYLPVSLFKSRILRSIPEREVIRTLSSSGTTSNSRSQVFLDAKTLQLQNLVLSKILASILGPKRLPMLIVDTRDVFNRHQNTARAAGILGFMTAGSRHTFLLGEGEEVNEEILFDFMDRNGSSPNLIYGLTFLVWSKLIKDCRNVKLDLSNSTVIHTGGWKKLENLRVSSEQFRKDLYDVFGITRVINYYGMVEQTGSIFVEGKCGLLHPSNFSDFLIRSERNLDTLGEKSPGIVQSFSKVPLSYPGHSLLTEDLGQLVNCIHESCWGGKSLQILGRIPKIELRGCSNV